MNPTFYSFSINQCDNRLELRRSKGAVCHHLNTEALTYFSRIQSAPISESQANIYSTLMHFLFFQSLGK